MTSLISPRVPSCWMLRVLLAGWFVACVPGRAWSAAEVRLDKDFLAGLVEKVPPCPFQKEGQYRGTVQAFRLAGIDPKARRFLVACQIAGEFRPPVQRALADRVKRGGASTEGWKSFRFDVKSGISVEPGRDGAPRFQVDVEEVKRRELEGLAGTLAKFLGRAFDEMVTQVADGNASRLGQKLNAEIVKRVKAFQEYGVFCAIDYAPAEVVLHFDVTRFKSEGPVGYVFAEPQPGTVPLYRWFHSRLGHHLYTTNPETPASPGYVREGIACHVFPEARPGTVPLSRWRIPRDTVLSTAPGLPALVRPVYRPDGIAGFLYPDPQPETVPFYQFVDPRNGRHFYTTHKYAEFAK